MKRLVILGLSLCTLTAYYAQTLQDAVKKVQNERYELAKKDFEALTKNNPTSVENAFFFGNYYVTIEDNAKAIEQFKAAAAKNPEDKLAKVAAAKATYFSGDTTAAGKAFCELIKATKNKNAMVLYRIAETYATGPKKNYNEAEVLLNQVIKLEPTNQDALMLLGDVILDQSTARVSETVNKYNEVLKVNPNNVDALVRKARIYERVGNKDAALQGYKDAIRLDPNFATSYRYHAELSMKQKNYDEAAKLWTKYLELNNDPEARFRYATSLFNGEKYQESLDEFKKVEAAGIVNHYTKRLMLYSLVELNTTGDTAVFTNCLKLSDEFFKLVAADKIIAKDYKYPGDIYAKKGDYKKATEYYTKAAALDIEAVAEPFSTLANGLFKAKNYAGVIEVHNAKIAAMPKKIKAADYFELGKAYFFNATPNYAMADSAFAQVTRLSANYALGYLWRGRALSQTDTDINNRTWKAKPEYEMYLTKLSDTDKANPSNKDNIMEANKYLGDYYVNSKDGKDLAKAKIHWAAVQALDPNDKQAKAFFSVH